MIPPTEFHRWRGYQIITLTSGDRCALKYGWKLLAWRVKDHIKSLCHKCYLTVRGYRANRRLRKMTDEERKAVMII
jgi:hypothetical protein